MKITEPFPDPDVLVALECDELGLRLLPWISGFPPDNRQLEFAVREIRESYDRGVRSVEMAVREAWAWLEGTALLIESPQFVSPNSVRVLSRRAARLSKAAGGAIGPWARLLPKDALHPLIREDVWALFHRGKYDTAVFEAMKAVEVHVRDTAKLDRGIVGVALVRRAFDKNSGPLTDMSMDEGEREARAHLFAGAIGSYKNPHSHRSVELDDPEEAAEIINLASHLLRIVDSRVQAERQDLN